MKNEEQKKFMTLEEMLEEQKKRPPIEYLWSGIKKKSFGLVFGPSKSGKTIFCENLAFKIAIGESQFLGETLNIKKAQNVLFIGLEEFWENRISRNKQQMLTYDASKRDLLKKHYLYQNIEYNSKIVTDHDWKQLNLLVEETKAKFVVIDSITRLNHGKLEDSDTAESILQNLRKICYGNSITLICIHHTPKMYGKPLDMDSIKGSSVFAQESDFAIGINNTKFKARYVKEVFFRYAADDSEEVREIIIDKNTNIQLVGKTTENKLLNKNDRRRASNTRDAIVEYFDASPCKTHRTADLIITLTDELSIGERQLKEYLKSLVAEEELANPKRGYYQSVKCCNNQEKEAKDEA
ncbi:AAA family ATPase [Maribacter luteus]|uniref:AAA family ATPase n=1 Tax=Maribacter luteus TaxID=2594478 RepID=A0A6I2MNR0_9FLAO|nr:AAA family ATPase [Maribacter luteus]MRX64379.1 AAA family ATPase [Maribacter luteus]